MPSGGSLSLPDRVMDGVIGDVMLTPAYLTMTSCPSLNTFIRSASVCNSFSTSALGYRGMHRGVWTGRRGEAGMLEEFGLIRCKCDAGLIYNYSLLPQAL